MRWPSVGVRNRRHLIGKPAPISGLAAYYLDLVTTTPEDPPQLEPREVQQVDAVAPKARLFSVD
jgi:hypothetical protein